MIARGTSFDKATTAQHTWRMREGSYVPVPLAVGFGLFVAALAYLVAASLARRDAPVFAATPAGHVRAADWMRAGDTLTLDATDGDTWRYASLSAGRALGTAPVDGWEIAAQRFRVTVN